MNNTVSIRLIEEMGNTLLEHFLYLAIYQREGETPLPKSIIYEQEIFRYIQDFGREHDWYLLAEIEGTPVGAVWVRLFPLDAPGFGYFDDTTVELAISVEQAYRNRGIGTALLDAMMKLLKEHSYQKVSLSVQKDNPAASWYERYDFTVFHENGEDYLMVCNLT